MLNFVVHLQTIAWTQIKIDLAQAHDVNPLRDRAEYCIRLAQISRRMMNWPS